MQVLKVSGQQQQRKGGNYKFSDTQGQLTQWPDLTEIRTHPSINACSYYLKASKRLE